MENSPLVSIITIVYNGEKYIENAILSVINQSYKNIEYVIIDGGSTDNTVSIIKKYQDHITSWISEKDAGISDAFNKGILRTTGEIIGILNSDDWYEKDTIAKAVANIENYDLVYGDLQLWKDDKMDFIVQGNHRLLTREMTINHPTVFVRKEYYTKFGSFDTQYKAAMDYELVLRFMINKCRFKYIPEVLAHMRWEGNSDKYWLKGCKETLQIKNKYLPHKKLQNSLFFIKHVIGISMPKYLEKIHLHFLVRAYRAKFSAQKKIYN
jgi:glycosyltransferase involved in cell wall biosynthesis